MQALLTRIHPTALNLMRIFVGFAYWTHGAGKILGWFGGMGGSGETVDYMTRWGAAGFIEITIGALIVLGFKTRFAALIASGEMAVAYWWIHVLGRDSVWFWANRGELPMVFCFVFLFMATTGGGTWSIDSWLGSRNDEATADGR